MVEGGEDDVVADLAAVANGYSPMVLEVAAGVDEDVLADVDVLSEVGVEGRKDA